MDDERKRAHELRNIEQPPQLGEKHLQREAYGLVVDLELRRRLLQTLDQGFEFAAKIRIVPLAGCVGGAEGDHTVHGALHSPGEGKRNQKLRRGHGFKRESTDVISV